MLALAVMYALIFWQVISVGAKGHEMILCIAYSFNVTELQRTIISSCCEHALVTTLCYASTRSKSTPQCSTTAGNTPVPSTHVYLGGTDTAGSSAFILYNRYHKQKQCAVAQQQLLLKGNLGNTAQCRRLTAMRLKHMQDKANPT
jgi:hypothetical protein